VRGGSVPELPEDGASIGALLRYQSGSCGRLGSTLYEDLLRRAADDFEQGGPTLEVLAGHEEDPGGSALALRFMGAVHRLALDGTAPELADRYDLADADAEGTWQAFRDTLSGHRELLRSLVERPVQTNEVGRCAALLPGFLEVATSTGLPLRLLEVGAAGGLLLRWDAYAYETDGFAWGPPDSALRIAFELEGAPMPAAVPVEVAERQGCDASPIDLSCAEGRHTLLSYIWPDQAIRLRRARAAIELAGELPVRVERVAAPGWITEQLGRAAPGLATVVYHSVVMQYLTGAERDHFETAIREAGRRASAEAPLAWLRMEPAGGRAELRLSSWPGGEDRRLGYAGYHGTPVDLEAAAGWRCQ
jgi:hypothetical protein